MTTELQREWDGPSDRKALDYLKARGFTLRTDYSWSIPANFSVADKDLRAIMFLEEEWDYRSAVYQEPEIIPPRSRRN